MAKTDRKQFEVGGHTLSVSNLDKVLYPETGTTKADVMHYYLSVAEVLIPHIALRPVTRKRWVDGVGTPENPGQVFFRKDLETSAPDWIKTGTIKHSEHSNTYPLVDGPAALAWFAQVAALELHTPQWRFGDNGRPRNPDRLVLDLDPGEGVDLAECAQVARWCKEILDGMEMLSVPVTSGSKGIHLYAGLDGSHNADQVSKVAHELAKGLEADHPDLIISTMKKADRAGKVFIDWSQNNGSKTTVSPYSLRGRARPTVAAPRTWEELEDPKLAQLELGEVLDRVSADKDPLSPLLSGLGDRLSKYRSMRDPKKTREPVPAEAPKERERQAGELPSFVIQEHHARRLHWDFRLEHSGVLVSWAVPKGPPLQHDENRLAVMTEDHPLEYGTFEGTIPKGEYGAGEVSIWDSGVYECEKWRDGKEVIAVLHGSPDGGLGGKPRRYALIQAKGMGKENDWLIRLMDEQPKENASESSKGGASKSRAQGGESSFSLTDLPSPMLLSSGKPSDVSDGRWAFEMKWDGYRIIAGIGAGKVLLASRNGKDLTSKFPAAAELTQLLSGEALEAGGAIIDAELVALDSRGRPDFGLLQASMKEGKTATNNVGEPAELRLIVFDLLAIGVPGSTQARSLIKEPYESRRELLEKCLQEGDSVSIPPMHRGSVQEAIKASEELGLEGIVAKRLDSTYLSGTRGKAWLKLKTQPHQEVVVIGARHGQGSRSGGIGSLLVAVPDEDSTLQYAGRVGSGFSERQLSEISHKLKPLERKTPPVSDVPESDQADAWWVTPKLVGEVKLAGKTRDGKLRQAVWRGWREDKSAEEVRWEV